MSIISIEAHIYVKQILGKFKLMKWPRVKNIPGISIHHCHICFLLCSKSLYILPLDIRYTKKLQQVATNQPQQHAEFWLIHSTRKLDMKKVEFATQMEEIIEIIEDHLLDEKKFH